MDFKSCPRHKSTIADGQLYCYDYETTGYSSFVFSIGLVVLIIRASKVIKWDSDVIIKEKEASY